MPEDDLSSDNLRRVRRRVYVATASATGLVLATTVVWWYALGQQMPLPGFELSAEGAESFLKSWGGWSVVVAILLMVLHSFIPFPAEVVAIANGMLFGPLWGTVITWTGAMLGALLAFGLARWLGRPFVFAMVAQRHWEALDRWAAQQGVGALLFSRFVPVISFNLINYAAGLTAITWWTFTWVTGIGILPLTVLMVVMGGQLWSGDVSALLGLLAIGLVAWFIWWWASRQRRLTGRGASTTMAKSPSPLAPPSERSG